MTPWVGTAQAVGQRVTPLKRMKAATAASSSFGIIYRILPQMETDLRGRSPPSDRFESRHQILQIGVVAICDLLEPANECWLVVVHPCSSQQILLGRRECNLPEVRRYRTARLVVDVHARRNSRSLLDGCVLGPDCRLVRMLSYVGGGVRVVFWLMDRGQDPRMPGSEPGATQSSGEAEQQA